MTAEIAQHDRRGAAPQGVAVVIEAAQSNALTTPRRPTSAGVSNGVTSRMLGVFRADATTRREVLSMIGTPAGSGSGNV